VPFGFDEFVPPFFTAVRNIRHFAGKPPKVIRRPCGSVVLRNRAECCSTSLVLTGIGSASRRDGDAVFRLLLSMAPHSVISLDLSDGPMNDVPLHRGTAALFELNGSRRNYRNSFITTTPTRMHSELHGIVRPEAARAQWPRSTAIIVPSSSPLRIDNFFACCGFRGHSNDMGWPSTNYESD
jgi:hypothetical protein